MKKKLIAIALTLAMFSQNISGYRVLAKESAESAAEMEAAVGTGIEEEENLIQQYDSLEEFAEQVSEVTGDTIQEVESGSMARLMVKVNTGADIQPLNAKEVVEYGDLYILTYENGQDAEAAYQEFSNNPDIEYVEKDAIVEVSDAESQKGNLNEKEKLTLQEAIEEGKSGQKEVYVAIVDTGLCLSGDALLQNRVAENWKESFLIDENGHGTHIAALIANATNQNIKLMPIKVADANGKCTILQLYLGIRYAIESGADVINISMSTKDIASSALLSEIAKEASEEEIIVVASAGNDADNVLNYAPANISSVITVGSVDSNKEASEFSNYGDTIDCVSYGENITVVKYQGTEVVSGTSYSAALVTAELAKQIENGNINSSTEADKYIKTAAVDLGEAGWDEIFGYGLIGDYTYPADDDKARQQESEETEVESGHSHDTSEENGILHDSSHTYMLDAAGNIIDQDTKEVYLSKTEYLKVIERDEHGDMLVVTSREQDADWKDILSRNGYDENGEMKENKELEKLSKLAAKFGLELENARYFKDEDGTAYIYAYDNEILICYDLLGKEVKDTEVLDSIGSLHSAVAAAKSPTGHTHDSIDSTEDNMKYTTSIQILPTIKPESKSVSINKTGYHTTTCGGCRSCTVTTYSTYEWWNTYWCESCNESYGDAKHTDQTFTCSTHNWSHTIPQVLLWGQCRLYKGIITAGALYGSVQHLYCPGHETANTYIIKYNKNSSDATGTMSDTSATYDINVTLRTNIYARTGYAFSGWAKSTSGAITYANSASVKNLTATNNGTVNLYAKWTPNVYTITLDKQSGSGGTDAYYEKYNTGNYTTSGCTTTISSVTKPTKEGYTFQGYYTGTGGSGTQYVNNAGTISSTKTTFTAKITLYAYWTENKGTVLYNVNGGTIMNAPHMHTDTNTGTVTYYKLVNGIVQKCSTASGTYANVTTTVKYTDSTEKNLSNVSTFGLEKTGWHIDGATAWISSDGKTTFNQDSTSTSLPVLTALQTLLSVNTKNGETTTLYANWIANTYTVIYNKNGATSGTMSNSSHTYGTASSLSANKYRKEYTYTYYANGTNSDAKIGGKSSSSELYEATFGDWYKEAACTNVVANADNLTDTNKGTVTVYAKWSNITAKLPIATWTGYNHLGWSTNSKASTPDSGYKTGESVSVTDEKTLYAVWQLKNYPIRYDANGGSGIIADETKYWNTDYILKENSFVHPGYEFLGWSRDKDAETPEYLPENVYTDVVESNYDAGKSVTFYAIWRINFNVAYIGNDQTSGTDFIDSGEDGYGIVRSSEYTMDDNQSEEGENFSIEKEDTSIIDSETGEPLTQTITGMVVGWGTENDDPLKPTFELNETASAENVYNEMNRFNSRNNNNKYITSGSPNSDYSFSSSLLMDNTLFLSSSDNQMDGLSAMKAENNGVLPFANPATPYVNVYAVYDYGPAIEAYDTYYTLREAQEGKITEEELLSNVNAYDEELKTASNPKGKLAKGRDSINDTLFDIWDYSPEDFTKMKHSGSVTETFRAVDSIGNTTYYMIRVYVVNDTIVDVNQKTGKTRFISKDYFPDSFEEGSIWIENEEYYNELYEVLNNEKVDKELTDSVPIFGTMFQHEIEASGYWVTPPQQVWIITNEKKEEMREFIKEYGFSNYKNPDGLKKFLEKFEDCRVE